jgi:hypothetical protein
LSPLQLGAPRTRSEKLTASTIRAASDESPNLSPRFVAIKNARGGKPGVLFGRVLLGRG